MRGSNSERLPPLEKEIQSQILLLLKILQNCNQLAYYRVANGPVIAGNKFHKVFKKNPSPGLPDIIVLLPNGKTLWAEVKRPKIGVLSEAQEAFKETCVKLGHYHYIWTSVRDAEDTLHAHGVKETNYLMPWCSIEK